MSGEQEQQSLLQSLAQKLVDWDRELDAMKNRASDLTDEKKSQLNKMADDLKAQAGNLKTRVDEYARKSPDEFKKEGEELLRSTSGKIADGLKHLATFFESRAASSSSGTSQPPAAQTPSGEGTSSAADSSTQTPSGSG